MNSTSYFILASLIAGCAADIAPTPPNPLDHGVDFVFGSGSEMSFEQANAQGRSVVTSPIEEGAVRVRRVRDVLEVSELVVEFAPIPIQTRTLRMEFVTVVATLDEPTSMPITQTDAAGAVFAEGRASFVLRFRVRWDDGTLSAEQEISLPTVHMNAAVRGGSTLDLSLRAEQNSEFASWLGLLRLSNIVFDLHAGEPPQI